MGDRGKALTPGLRFTVMKNQFAVAAKTLEKRQTQKGNCQLNRLMQRRIPDSAETERRSRQSCRMIKGPLRIPDFKVFAVTYPDINQWTRILARVTVASLLLPPLLVRAPHGLSTWICCSPTNNIKVKCIWTSHLASIWVKSVYLYSAFKNNRCWPKVLHRWSKW